jgi:hypothetical protein
VPLSAIPSSLPVATVTPDETDLAILKRHYPDADPAKPPWQEIRATLLARGVPLATVDGVTSRDLVRILDRLGNNGQNADTQQSGSAIDESLQGTVRRLSEQVKSVTEKIVASFRSSSPNERVQQIRQATTEISLAAFPLITWIERNRAGSANLEKQRFLQLENLAEGCAASDIPEYANGVIAERTKDSPPISDGLRLVAELSVYSLMFSKAILGWADEIDLVERASKAVRSTDDGPWSDPDTPASWAKRFDIGWDTLKKRFESQTIRNKKLSSKSYRVHLDDVPGTKSE